MRSTKNTYSSDWGNGDSRLVSHGLPDPYRIQVIDRAALILDCFSFEQPELSLREITASVGLHKGTAHRILRALACNGLIQQSPTTGNYHLGFKLFRLGNQAVSRLNLREIARPYIVRLMEQTLETVHLAVLDEDKVLYLEKVEGPHALRLPSRVGRHIPTYCTSLGKAMLSCVEESEVRRIIRRYPIRPYTSNTVKKLAELLTELKATRRRGYAVDNEEIEIGLRCVGAPLRDYSRRMVGAISVAGPSARLTLDKITFLSDLVKKAAASICEQLGYGKVELLVERYMEQELSSGRAE